MCYVCVHVCMHACAHAGMYVFLYICINIRMFTCIHVCVCIHVFHVHRRIIIYTGTGHSQDHCFSTGPKTPTLPPRPWTSNSESTILLNRKLQNLSVSLQIYPYIYLSVKYRNTLFHIRFLNTYQISDMCLELRV